jgi:hypothetical protein
VVDRTLEPHDPRRWAAVSDFRLGLILYSDGTTRIAKRVVRRQITIATRPELLVLGCWYYNKLTPFYVAVSSADWQAWEQQVQAAADPASLPPVPRRHRSSRGSLDD